MDENAARAIIDWFAGFGVSHGLMSDGPTHFDDETLRMVGKGLKTQNHFRLLSCPWSNDAVKRLGKKVV